MRSSIVFAAFALLQVACSRQNGTAEDAGTPAPVPTWAITYTGSEFGRAIDVSCTQSDGGEDCVGLTRFRNTLEEFPDGGETVAGAYGNLLASRFDTDGGLSWQRVVVHGFAPQYGRNGELVDDDTRITLLPQGYLIGTTVKGVVLIGQADIDPNQELGGAHDSALMLEYLPDGSFSDNWEQAVNDRENHLLGTALLPDSNLAFVGSCQGDFPLDQGTIDCGAGTSGFILTTTFSGNTVGGALLHGAPWARTTDIATDAEGNVFVSGEFVNSLTMDAATSTLYSAGEEDAFLMKVDPSGKRLWTAFASGLGHERSGRIARVPGGTLWSTYVSEGAVVGTSFFDRSGPVLALIADDGHEVWSEPVGYQIDTSGPLRVVAAADGSFALFGESYLGVYSAAGDLMWSRTGTEVRGAAFTQHSLVVAATIVGTDAFGKSVAAGQDHRLRAVFASFAH